MGAVMGGAEDAEVVAKVALALEARFARLAFRQVLKTASKCVCGDCVVVARGGTMLAAQLTVFLTVAVRTKFLGTLVPSLTPIGSAVRVTAIVSRAPAFDSDSTSTFKVDCAPVPAFPGCLTPSFCSTFM